MEGKIALAFVCGPILLRHPDSFIEQDILAKVKSLPIDKTSLMRTLPEIPVFSERRVQAAADLLFMMANYFSKIDSAFPTPAARNHPAAIPPGRRTFFKEDWGIGIAEPSLSESLFQRRISQRKGAD